MVDDTPANIRLLEAVLAPRNYTVLPAASGRDALELISRERPDLILLDILMPEMDGYEVCRRLRDDPATRALPVVMITASGDQEKLRALEAGADDFIPKPFNQAELLARVRSLLRVKQYYDVIQAQTDELAELNRTLEDRVQQQLSELERMGRLRRFLSPQIADVVVSSGDETILRSHRRQVAVIFCDLRGFTGFSEDPEEVMAVLGEYHEAMGALISAAEATVGFFEGAGLMVFFNDPLPCPEPAAQAVRLAVSMRDRMEEMLRAWGKRGHDLGFGVGIDFGYATLGQIGFEGRRDYGVIGNVVNLASRLCDEAASGQILLSQRVYAAVEQGLEVEPAGEFTLKGILKPVTAYRIVDLKERAVDGATVIAPSTGRTLASGRYIVRRALGEGGQKIVYLVHDLSLDRDCALALIKSALLEPEDRFRLQREGQAMARLGAHPNIVAVFDVGEDEGRPYIVYEYVPGGDLRQELRAAGGQLSISRALSVGSGIASALAEAHKRGIIHRDLKPGNVLLGEDREAKLGDFGLALAMDRSRLTMAGVVMGTAAYMSPEQALGQPTDARTDLYALGAMLYELVTGRPPFVGDSAAAVTSQHINAAPAAPSSHEAAVPPALDALIMRMLAKAPGDRPESASAVFEELSGMHERASP
ncbi:MAG: protein kinase [Dehalococcoidia bacterium]